MGTPAIGVPGLVLSGTIVPTRPSLTYRLGLLVVAVAMLLLPVIYLALVAGTAGVVWWHLTANAWMLEHANQWRLIGYLAPVIIGTVLVFFMIKPVLARAGTRVESMPLSRAQQPELFAFIDAICRQVRAPVPQRVQVDCQVNASAGFPPGYLSLFGKDLVLTIGLPLVAGLSVRELGGVLAHEFGHFAQGGGMRLTMVVRNINAWFARVVYERDQWDAKLEAWSKGGDWRVMFVLMLARGSVGLSRWALWGLMWTGHAISCFMLRQMEYDADSYEIKFAGSETFARTSARLRHLNAGAQLGYGDLRHWWQKRMLPANFPLFLTERSIRMPRDMVEQIGRVADAPTKLFDTHPSDADRIRAAEAAALQGVLVGGDLSATTLVRDFESLGAAVKGLPRQVPVLDIKQQMPEANVKPRLRMASLYFFANSLNYLVAGTGNRCELTLGYFTKYGDGGVDVLPIGSLLKSEVRQVARELGVPQPVIDKAPTAGLWMGQTDEAEMGFSYEVLEKYLVDGPGAVPERTAERIDQLRRTSDHKRTLPPIGPA